MESKIVSINFLEPYIKIYLSILYFKWILKWQAGFILFWGNVCQILTSLRYPNTQSWAPCLSVVLSSRIDIPHAHTAAQTLPQDSPLLWCAERWCASSTSSQRSKRRFTRARFDTMDNFYCFIRDILKWSWLFFFYWECSSKEHSDWHSTDGCDCSKHAVSPCAACAALMEKLKGERKWLSVQQFPHLRGVCSKTPVDAWNCG